MVIKEEKIINKYIYIYIFIVIIYINAVFTNLGKNKKRWNVLFIVKNLNGYEEYY